MPTRTIGRSRVAPPSAGGGWWGMIFVGTVAALGALLALVGGPPRPPTRPDLGAIRDALGSSDLRLWEGVASWLFLLGWAVWGWTALSLLVQGALALLVALARGAAWASRLRQRVGLSPLLMPLARRAFPVVAAATIVLRSGVAPAQAAPVERSPLVLVHAPTAPEGVDKLVARQGNGVREHVVAPGERAVDLALRYYGSEEEFERIHRANLGRLMPDGDVYRGRLVPGQILLVPAASYEVEIVDGQQVYTVAPGDTLSGIAARLLGDPAHWRLIFDANAGIAQMPDGRALSDPRLIWPGLRLVIPPAPGEAGLPTIYTVVRGDSLRLIAQHFYGDESLWPSIVEASRELAARDGYDLDDPDRIWPGQRFVIPAPAGVGTTQPAPPTALPAPAVQAPLAVPDLTARVGPTGLATVVVPPTESGETLAVTGVTQGTHGQAVITPDGTVAYRPAAGFSGSDRFTVTVRDARGRTASTTVAVEVPALAAAPAPAPPPTATPPPPAATATAPATTPSATAAATPTTTSVASPAATPIALPTAVPRELPAGAQPGRAPLVTLGGALGAGVLLGAGVFGARRMLARRDLRRRLRTRAAPVASREMGVEDEEPADFADPEVAQVLTHRAHGGEVEPPVAIAHHVARYCQQRDLDEAIVLLAVQEQEADASVHVTAPRALQERVVALAPDLGSLLGGKASGVPIRGSGDVELRFRGLSDAGVLAVLPERAASRLPTMIPLVELANGRQLFANWEALGNVLVAGLPGEGADTVLTGLVAILASRRHPDTLRLWTIASPQIFPDGLFGLPHWADGEGVQPIDPADVGRIGLLLADLRNELHLRREEPPDTVRPDLVIVLGELAGPSAASAEAADLATALASLLADGPAYGIRFVAATMRPDRLDAATLAHFPTRLVLRLAEEADSMRLLGSPDALGLGGGGQLLLALAGHAARGFAGLAPQRTRGFRVGADALAQLIEEWRAIDHEGLIPAPEGPVLAHATVASPLAAVAAPASERVLGEAMADGGTPTPTDRLLAEQAGEARPILAPHREDLTGPPGVTGAARADGERGLAPAPTPTNLLAPVDAGLASEGAAGPGDAAQAVLLVAGAPDLADRPADAVPPELMPLDGEDGGVPMASGAGGTNGHAPVTTNSAREVRAPTPATSPTGGDDEAPSPADEDDGPRLAADTPMEIRCFGRQFRVWYRGHEVRPIPSEKSWQLLQYLAVKPPREVTREAALAALWPDSPAQSERNFDNVKQVVRRLRNQLADQLRPIDPGFDTGFIHVDRVGHLLWLDPALVTVDVHRFWNLLHATPRLRELDEALEVYRQVEAIYRPELLGGARPPWLDIHDEDRELQEEYQGDWAEFVERLAQRCVREGRHDLATPLYQRLLKDRPLDEQIVRALVRCHAATGNAQAFVRDWRAFEHALRHQRSDPEDGPALPGYDPALDGPEPETLKVRDEVRTQLLGRTGGEGAADERTPVLTTTGA